MEYHSLIILGKESQIEDEMSRIAFKVLEIESYHSHPDYFSITNLQKLSIGIEEIHSINKFARQKPYQAPGKLIHIKNASAMTPEAQNALLKILEEPPTFTQIVLSAESRNNFLDTIISRCSIEELGVAMPDNVIQVPDSLIDRFKMILEIEKIKAPIDKKIFIKNLLTCLAENSKINLQSQINESTSQKAKEKLKLINEIHQKLAANVNPKLALEYLFIKLDSLN